MSKMDVMKKIQEARGGNKLLLWFGYRRHGKNFNNSHDRFSLIFKCFYLWYIQRNESPEGKRQKEKSMIIFIL